MGTSLKTPPAPKVQVIDADGKTAAALESLGLKAKQLKTPTNADLVGVKALIVGERTDPAPFKDVISPFVKAGGTVAIPDGSGSAVATIPLVANVPFHLEEHHASRVLQGTGAQLQIVFTSTARFNSQGTLCCNIRKRSHLHP